MPSLGLGRLRRRASTLVAWRTATSEAPAGRGLGSPRARRSLALVTWSLTGIMAVNAAAGRITGHGLPAPAPGLGLLAVDALLGVRLVLAAKAWPERRTGSLALAAGMVMVTAGEALAGEAGTHGGHVGGVAIALLLGFQAAQVVFVVLDEADHRRVTLGTALNAVIICGGVLSLAGLIFLSSLGADFTGQSARDVVAALTAPASQLALFVLVLAGAVMRRRAWSAPTVLLLAGLGLTTAANLLLLGRDLSDFPDTPGITLIWALGTGLIVAAANGPRIVPDSAGTATTSTPATLLATFCAGLVLIVSGAGNAPVQVGLASITMAAAMARLAQALRAARGAAEVQRLAGIDDLTGLPNRRGVLAWIKAAEDAGEGFGLVLADLDGFKIVNDTLGHVSGDAVLQAIGRRLKARERPGSLVARLGGDEFALLKNDADPEELLAAAARVRALIAQPLVVQGHELALGASVGVAIRPAGNAAASRLGAELLRRADVAMYQAKAQHAGALIYEQQADDSDEDSLRMAADLRHGLPEGQIEVWYQPQVDARTHAVTGLEALVRWRHPDRGILSPDLFLPLARRSGLMPDLTEIVLRTVLRDAARLAPARPALRISFNVAPAELLDGPLVARLLAAAERAGRPRGTLLLEITEDSLLADPERAAITLHEFSRHGIEVAIDDYGSGYSSLASLLHLPVDELKMDRSFVTAAANDPRSRSIVASTCHLARGLGLRTVAEGVEDAATAATLQDLGVDLLQGYHFARPMPYDDLCVWLEQRDHRSAPDAVRTGALD